jgi:hypothetical protein
LKRNIRIKLIKKHFGNCVSYFSFHLFFKFFQKFTPKNKREREKERELSNERIKSNARHQRRWFVNHSGVSVAHRVVCSRFKVVQTESFERLAKSFEEQISGRWNERKQINVHQLHQTKSSQRGSTRELRAFIPSRILAFGGNKTRGVFHRRRERSKRKFRLGSSFAKTVHKRRERRGSDHEKQISVLRSNGFERSSVAPQEQKLAVGHLVDVS